MLSKLIKNKKLSFPFIAFLQSWTLVVYTVIIGLIFSRGEEWFGPIYNFFGPLFFIILFVTSAIIAALVVLGYPFMLFWEEKKAQEALKLVAYTTVWLIVFVLLTIIALIVF